MLKIIAITHTLLNSYAVVGCDSEFQYLSIGTRTLHLQLIRYVFALFMINKLNTIVCNNLCAKMQV